MQPKSFYVTAWKVSRYKAFSGPYFPVFGLNTKIYTVNLHIQSEYMKLWKNVCVKSAWKVSKYRVFCGPYFPVFGLKMEVYSINLHENLHENLTGKYGPEKTLKKKKKILYRFYSWFAMSNYFYSECNFFLWGDGNNFGKNFMENCAFN